MPPADDLRGLPSGRPYPLESASFDSGGGGGLFYVRGDAAVVAKLWPTPCRVTDEPGRRIRAVLARRIASPYLAGVIDLLVRGDDPDTAVGFVMGRVHGHTLYSVTNPDERERIPALPLCLCPVDRLKLAAEIARAFEAIHRLNMRLADAHHRNVMVTFDRSGRVAGVVLLEPDTWLFEWRDPSGRMEAFRSLARADFLPREFQAADLGKTPLTFESDRFALALLVSLALFDCTPQAFAGSGLAVGQRIARGYEWLTPNLPPGATPPGGLPLDPRAVPDAVMDLLRRALSPTPGDRPTAAEHAAALADWHRRALDAAVASRFVAALAALRRARSLADLSRRAAEAFFAALRRYCPATAARPTGWWLALAAKVAVPVLLVAGLAVWAGRSPVGPAPAEPPPASRRPAPKKPPPAVWRNLLERHDPDPE